MLISGLEGVVNAKALGQERIVCLRSYRDVTIGGGSESFRKHPEEPLFRWLLVSR